MATVEVVAPASSPERPHAVCIPYPAQGHVNPMLKLAKLLHHRGFHVTFVNSEYNHRRLLKSRGPDSLDGIPSFRFRTILDGLPPDDADTTQDIPSLCDSTRRNCLPYFRELVSELNRDGPTITCIVSDATMSFTLDVAEELGVPGVLLWTASACGFMGYVQYSRLVEQGYTPLKDASYLTNGYLDTVIDWIPGIKNIRLRDLPSFIRTTDPNDIMLNFAIGVCERARGASTIIVNTFESLEHDVLDGLRTVYPCPVYSIGPLQLLLDDQAHDPELRSIGSNLWKEDTSCLDWLDTQEPNSVVYVNFGSITVMTNQQLVEFAWGLANSEYHFLWIIRPDLVTGESAVLPAEFTEATKGRGMLASWCPQEKVLSHPSIGGFLTHSGWNSTLESICAGVPLVSWPFFADQQTNCWYCRTELGIGMEIDENVRREVVERQVRELMEGEAGKAMREKAREWRRMAEAAAACGRGTSYSSLEEVVKNVLLTGRKN